MQHAMSRRELEQLQMRIDASPLDMRDELQAQMNELVRKLDQQTTPISAAQTERDAQVEALFDNMPV